MGEDVHAHHLSITAGLGLGLNRAMLFFVDEARRELRGVAAAGPADRTEADRVWRSIVAESPDLQTLYQAGLRRRVEPGELDRRVRGTRVSADGDSPIALALRGSCVSGEGSDDLDGLLDLKTCVAAPLRSQHRVEGVLYADNVFTGLALDPVARLVFAMIADHAGRAIDQARSFEELARAARTDSLTGLGHHGAMMEALTEAVADPRPTGLALVDLDDFKGVNDRLGHLAGDSLLAGVAARLSAVVRAGERAFRYGGEEFAVLLPAVGADALGPIGERIRRTIADRPFSVRADLSLRVTCSVGVAMRQGTDAAGLIEAADAALLRAKAGGKNRVELD